MSSNYKEVPSWDLPDTPNPETSGTPESDTPDERADNDSHSTFDAIEKALREVATQLDESEPAAGSHATASYAPAPDVDAVAREYTRSFTELAQRIDALETRSDMESLRDEIRGLRQRLVENTDQFNRALVDSGGKVSELTNTVDSLSSNFAGLRDESAQLVNTVEEKLGDLNRRLEFAHPQSDDTGARLDEEVERRVSLTEQNIERMAERLEEAELGRDKKDYAVKQALTALLERLSAEKQRNESALAEARSSFSSELEGMQQALDTNLQDLTQRLEHSDPHNSGSEEAFDDIIRRLEQVERDNAAVQPLDVIVSDINRRLEKMEQRETEDEDAIGQNVEAMSRRLERMEQERGASEQQLREIAGEFTRRFEQLEQYRDAGIQPLNAMVGEIGRRLERMEQSDNGAGDTLGKAVEALSLRLEQMEQDRNAGGQPLHAMVGDINRRLEMMEQDGSERGDAHGDAVERLSLRLEQMEQDRNASIQPLNVIVGDINRRLERMETDNVSKLSLFEESIADLRDELATARDQSANPQSDVRESKREPESVPSSFVTPEQEPMAEPAFESLSPVQSESLRPVADIIQELTASQTMEGPQLGARDLNVELPELAARREIATEDLSPIVPPSFEMPPIDSTPPRGPSMREMISGETISRLPQSDESPSDWQDDLAEDDGDLPNEANSNQHQWDEQPSETPIGLIEDEDAFSDEPISEQPQRDEQFSQAPAELVEDDDYLLDGSVATTTMADVVNLGDVSNSSLKPLARERMGFMEKLSRLSRIGLAKIRAVPMSAVLKQNRYAAAGAAILLLAGTGVVLFTRGQLPNTGANIAEIDPSILAQQTATETGSAGLLAPDGAAAANPSALPTVEVQGPAISQLTPSALRANAPGAPAMLESLITQANAGSSDAALLLGLMYLNGDGVETNDNIAFWWLRLAAEQGEPIAQNSLGSLFERGQGVGADAGEAAFWYAQAAESGNVVAMHNLAIAYTDGAGVETNLSEAARLFEDAANFGLADSQFNLAVLYSRGMGVPASQSEAYKWYLIAAEQGDPEAGTQAQALASQLAQTEREAATAEAAAFVPQLRNEGANALPELAQIQ